MIDRLAQLVADRVLPHLERRIDERFDELETLIEDRLEQSFDGAVSTFNIYVAKTLPSLKKDIKDEINSEIVRGFKI